MKVIFNLIRILVPALFLTVVIASCASRPACKTSWGKKKLKYYNSIQYK